MTPTALLPDRRSLELLGVEPRVQAAPRPRSGMPAARAADSSSAWVASGLAYSRLSRTLAWKRYVSCVTNPITDPREARVRRRISAPSISIPPASTSYSRGRRYVVVVLPEPDGPTSATSSPGAASRSIPSTPNGCAGSVAAAAESSGPSWPSVGAASAPASLAGTTAAPAGYRNATFRKVTPPRTVAGSRATASGGAPISGSISRYSKIRSNSASAPWISTWIPRSWPSGKKSRDWRVVNATMSPIVGALGSPLMASQAPVQAPEPPDRRVLLAECLGQEHPRDRERLLGHGAQLRERALGGPADLASHLAHPVGQVHEERPGAPRQRGQAPVDDQH